MKKPFADLIGFIKEKDLPIPCGTELSLDTDGCLIPRQHGKILIALTGEIINQSRILIRGESALVFNWKQEVSHDQLL